MPMSSPEPIAGGELLLVSPLKSSRGRAAFLRRISQWLAIGASAVGSYYGISHFILQSVTVVGLSMAPTLFDSQHYLLNRWIYHVRAPHRSEIVVLRDPTDNTFAVKRVVGVSGDTIYLKDGDVYVNGEKLAEPYLAPGTATFAYAPFKEQSFKCGQDQYFVMGDNRRNSADSRTYGPIRRQNVLGLIIR